MIELLIRMINKFERELNVDFIAPASSLKAWVAGITDEPEKMEEFKNKEGWKIVDCSSDSIAEFVVQDLKKKGAKVEPGKGNMVYCYKK